MTETFDATWLDLRESVDHRSRAVALLTPLREWWVRTERSSVLDLGCGSGSNLRYLAPRLPGPQRWTLIDHDEALLEKIRVPPGDLTVRTLCADLGEVIAEVHAADLVAASALLDLVSESWLRELANACVAGRCGVLFALSYDGIVSWQGDDDPLDRTVLDAVNEHQLRDKGLGPALGPTAGRTAERIFREAGYETWLVASPWELGQDDEGLVRPLLDGWVSAAGEQRPGVAEAARAWAERRATAVATGQAHLSVGHCDVLALPQSA